MPTRTNLESIGESPTSSSDSDVTTATAAEFNQVKLHAQNQIILTKVLQKKDQVMTS